MRQLRILATATAVVGFSFVVALGGCKKKEAGALLSYVPADTPYVIANIEPLPKAYTDGVAAKFAPVATMYEQMIDDGLAALAKGDTKEIGNRVGTALLSEIKGKISVAGIESLGFSMQSHSAMYGVGLAPVMRIELKDPDAFKAFIGRVEKRVGEAIPTAKIADQTFWRFGKAGEPLVGLAMMQGNQLVMSVIPADASVGLVKSLFGINPPAKSLADSGGLEALNKQYGFTPNGSGYIDVQRVFQSMLDAQNGPEKEYVKALGGKNETIAPECRAEMMSVAANFPRAVVGYTRLEPTAMEVRFVVETKPELAKAMSALVAPVPGLGGASDALFDFGASLNIGKMIDFLTAQANAVAAAPYKCAELANLNQSFAKMKTDLSNPMAYAAAPVLKGFHIAVDRYDAPPGAMPQVAGKVLIASDNPQTLIGMAQQYVPQLASMKLAANAAPVPLPAGLAPGVPASYIAYNDKALGVAVGEGEQAGLPAFLAAPPANPAPAFVLSYGGKFFELIAKNMEAAAALAPPEEQAKLQRQTALMKELYGKVLKRTDMALLLTDRGIELRETMLLN